MIKISVKLNGKQTEATTLKDSIQHEIMRIMHQEFEQQLLESIQEDEEYSDFVSAKKKLKNLSIGINVTCQKL